ncbi:nuclease [Rhodopseudomonas palustris]|nr:nuclease [Rhodopseudomonas palustris]
MGAAAAVFAFSNSTAADPIAPDRIEVIDGDTIRIDGRSPSHRLVGFNAPETFRAANPAEHELGLKAAERLRALVRAGNLDYTEVPCSCRPGTEGTPACNHGRRCGTLRAAGEDVGEILIREGLAVPFICGRTGCPPTPGGESHHRPQPALPRRPR